MNDHVSAGDPKQLPATVISTSDTAAQYQRSLFERLMSEGHLVHVLDTQVMAPGAAVCSPARAAHAVSELEHLTSAVPPALLPNCPTRSTACTLPFVSSLRTTSTVAFSKTGALQAS
jgi:hypothetical protein